MDPIQPSDVLAGDPVAMASYERVRSELEALGRVKVRVTKSQVAFRRRRGFARLWRPGMYLRQATVPVVLTIALGRHDASARFSEVVHPSPRHWMHHRQVTDPAQIDDDVAGWLREAAERAREDPERA